MRNGIGWLLVLVGLAAVRVDATDIYVATNGSDGAHSDWSTAYTNIQAALDAAVDGDTVYVAGHTFLTASQLVWQAKSIDVLGGYAATNDAELPGTRDIDAHPTVLERSGTANHRVLYINNATNALLEGFVLRNGRYVISGGVLGEGDGGAGIRAEFCTNLTIASCVIVSNGLPGLNANINANGPGIYAIDSYGTITNTLVTENWTSGNKPNTGAGQGGGIMLRRGGWTIVDCVISNNDCALGYNGGNNGGGLYIDGEAHVVRRTTIRDNQVAGGGSKLRRAGGLYMVSGTVEDCLIVSNSMTTTSSGTADGGGVYMEAGLLRNSLVAGCTSIEDGGGIYASGGIIENVTVAGNVSINGGTVAGAFLTGSSTVTNSIFYANERAFDSADISVSETGGALDYSCTTPVRVGSYNISLDPQFLDPDAGDYRLLPGSPAIDTGTNQTWMTGRSDVVGNPRIRNAIVDMGAYESDLSNSGALTANLIADVTEGRNSLQVVLTAHVAGSNQTSLVYRWDFENTGSFDVEGSGRQIVTNIYGPGVYSVRLVVENGAAESDTVIRTDYITVVPLDIYVSSAGDHSTGESWAKAFTSIQVAINAASVSNNIHIRGETFHVDPGLTWGSHDTVVIRGGYEGVGSPGATDPAQWPTIIEYTGSDDRVIEAIDLTDCTLEGVTITGGRFVIPGNVLGEGDGGAGIRTKFCTNLTIASCVIVSNGLPGLNANINANGPGIYAIDSYGTITNTLVAENWTRGNKSNTGAGQGGGIMLRRGGWTIVDCVISNNDCALGYNGGNNGGGLYIDGEAHVVRRTTIRDNQVAGGGAKLRRAGGLYMVSGTVEDCLIVSNSMTTTSSGTAYGGGVFMAAGLLRNSLVAGCTSIEDGGGIYASGGIIENVTVAGNVSINGGTVAGAFLTGSPTVTNSIFYANERAFDSADISVSETGGALDYSCTTPVRVGSYNTSLDPQFQDPGAGDYRLLPGSPAIDTGTNQTWMTGRTDVAGINRILNGVVDMGAYEFVPPPGTMILFK